MLLHEKKGSLYAIMSGLCYGLVGYFGITIVHAHLSVFNMLFWRFLISSILVGLLIIATRKAMHEKRRELLKVLFYGAALYSGGAITYFTSSLYIGTGLAMVTFFTYPAMVILFNWFFYRKPIPNAYYAAIALIVTGMILLADLGKLKCDILGIGLGILSSIFYTGYILSSKKNSASPLVSTFMVSLGCTMTLFILTIMHHSFVMPTTFSLWSYIFGMSIICTALPILLLLEGLKYISEEKASILSALEPVFSVVFGIILLGEKISIPQSAGVITILSGALITLFSNSNQK